MIRDAVQSMNVTQRNVCLNSVHGCILDVNILSGLQKNNFFKPEKFALHTNGGKDNMHKGKHQEKRPFWMWRQRKCATTVIFRRPNRTF